MEVSHSSFVISQDKGHKDKDKMEVYCTRSGCPAPQNYFGIEDSKTLKTVQKYCTTCGMPLILVGRYLPLKLGTRGFERFARDRYTPGMRQCG